MQISKEHSYFQIVNEENKTYLKLVRGKEPLLSGDIIDYLNKYQISYNLNDLTKIVGNVVGETVIKLNELMTR